MAQWKKVIVSGSRAEFTDASGSFSGSFFGDGSGLSGVAASFPTTYIAPADATKVFVNDGASKFTSASALADYTFGKISGDATVAAGGALTIANNAIEFGMLNDAAFTITASGDLTGQAALSSDKLSLALTIASDAVEASMIADAATGSILNTIAGDVNVSTGGVSTIQANAVEGTMLNTNVADTSTIEVSSNTLSVLKVPNALTAGTGLSSNNGTFDGSGAATFTVDYGSSAGDAVEGNTTITLTQTANEIDITGTAAQALGGGPSYTIGLADTISGNRTFSGDVITINKDLVVQGTASFQSTKNLEVADQFILLNSGSSTDNSPGGFVVQQNVQDKGVLFGYDAAAASNAGRFGVTSSFDASSTTFTADAYIAMVIDEDASQTDIALYQQRGNLRIDASDNIYIYV